MNHKHVQVIMEDHDYCGEYDTWEVINDLINYVECVEKGDAEAHYKNCIAFKENKDQPKE